MVLMLCDGFMWTGRSRIQADTRCEILWLCCFNWLSELCNCVRFLLKIVFCTVLTWTTIGCWTIDAANILELFGSVLSLG